MKKLLYLPIFLLALSMFACGDDEENSAPKGGKTENVETDEPAVDSLASGIGLAFHWNQDTVRVGCEGGEVSVYDVDNRESFTAPRYYWLVGAYVLDMEHYTNWYGKSEYLDAQELHPDASNWNICLYIVDGGWFYAKQTAGKGEIFCTIEPNGTGQERRMCLFVEEYDRFERVFFIQAGN